MDMSQKYGFIWYLLARFGPDGAVEEPRDPPMYFYKVDGSHTRSNISWTVDGVSSRGHTYNDMEPNVTKAALANDVVDIEDFYGL